MTNVIPLSVSRPEARNNRSTCSGTTNDRATPGPEEPLRSAALPSVTVIVPVYHGAHLIGDCLRSLLGQRYPKGAFEIIVVDDGSVDETPTIVSRYPVRLVRSQRGGPAAARNRGLGLATTDIIAFTDSDCIADPDWLAELVSPYADPLVGGVAGAIESFRHDGETAVEQFAHVCNPLVNYYSGPHEFLPHAYTANASYRRSVLEDVGGFNASLFTGEDVDLSWRLQLTSRYRLAYAERATIYHRQRRDRGRLGLQYRQYGFGEILLDTLYQDHAAYPRTRGFQLQRIQGQFRALGRCAGSIILRRLRQATGQGTAVDVEISSLWFLVELNNILGKLDALVATRFMTTASGLTEKKALDYARRYYRPAELHADERANLSNMCSQESRMSIGQSHPSCRNLTSELVVDAVPGTREVASLCSAADDVAGRK